MNRARRNSSAEGLFLANSGDTRVQGAINYFNVNLHLMQTEFAGYASAPPAAFDRRLYLAAQAHSDDLIDRDAQDHTGQLARVTAAGFVYSAIRGNVFSYSIDALYGHAAFNIDWGYGADGMQAGRGHRQAIMSLDGDYTNIGIAAVADSNPSTDVGPWVVTGNYAKAGTWATDHYNRFIVGTVWQDSNDNGRYDAGEGLSGVTVTPDQGAFFAVTAAGGGYAIPIVATGEYVVTFSGSALPTDYVRSVSVGQTSVLLDLDEPSSVPDADGDGIPDDTDNCPALANADQADADVDGIGDRCDACPADAANDIDEDGVCGDVDNCPINANPNQADTDADGAGDLCDACPADAANDIDEDGVCGDVDNCPINANPNQADTDADGAGDLCDACPADAANDIDEDGVCGDVDNCPINANPNQADTDADGAGDLCDACPADAANDIDEDGICGDVDNCPVNANPGQDDTDADGIGDLCDSCPADAANDVDEDGVCGDVDNCPINANPGQIDTDEDGTGDLCDSCPADAANDVDEDGVCGDVDNCPINANPGQTDTDEDGIGDACDTAGEPVVSTAAVCGTPGEPLTLPINLNKQGIPVGSVDFTLSYAPEQFCVANATSDIRCSAAATAAGFSCTGVADCEAGTVQVNVTPPIVVPVPELPEGEIVDIMLAVDSNAVLGSGSVCTDQPPECNPLAFTSVDCGDTDGQAVGCVAQDGCADVLGCDQGDCNGDGAVTTADVTSTILRLFEQIPQMSACEDCNGDGNLSTADVTCAILCNFGLCP